MRGENYATSFASQFKKSIRIVNRAIFGAIYIY